MKQEKYDVRESEKPAPKKHPRPKKLPHGSKNNSKAHDPFPHGGGMGTGISHGTSNADGGGGAVAGGAVAGGAAALAVSAVYASSMAFDGGSSHGHGGGDGGGDGGG